MLCYCTASGQWKPDPCPQEAIEIEATWKDNPLIQGAIEESRRTGRPLLESQRLTGEARNAALAGGG